MTLPELSEAYLEHINHLEMRILQLKAKIENLENEDLCFEITERIKLLENMCNDAKQLQSSIKQIALRAQAEAERNDPLTLEELREMDGEPVWVTQPSDTLLPFWGLVNVEDETVSGNLYCATFEDYDIEWLAYRRKPEDTNAD